MESTEFFEAMDRKELSDATDHHDGNPGRSRTFASRVIGVKSARPKGDGKPIDWK